MELDAILMLIRITKDGIKDSNSLLIMESYIYNKNIDINLSIRENTHLLIEEDEDIKDNSLITSILSSKENYYDVKIYNLLLENIKMRNFLIGAFKKNLLSNEAILDIIETILTGAQSIDNSPSRDQVLQFLVDFLSKKSISNKTLMQNSLIINTFVKNCVPYLIDDKSTAKDKLHNSFFERIVLYKLFANGYATFYYNQVINPDDPNNGIADIVLRLVRTRSYGHLRLMINKATIKMEDLDELKDAIKKGFKEFYDGDVDPVDAKRDADFIDKINLFFSLVKVECLNYEEMAKPSFKLS